MISTGAMPSQVVEPTPSLPPGGKVLRTEKVGSGHYTNMTMKPLKTGFPHLDSYGEARKSVAYASVDGYCRQLRNARKKILSSTPGSAAMSHANVDAAARDAVRCIEHCMVVVSGEKSVHRCVVTNAQNPDEKNSDPHYERALLMSYSYVSSAAVDRLLDLIEYTFLREGGCATNLAGVDGVETIPDLDIRAAASAAVAGLRIVDGVRMLGPSLSKLCEITGGTSKGPSEATIASALCISLHRSTVKNCSKTLENLARAIQNDPLDGPKHRPSDARVATVSSDVVHAIRIISPFVSAYKSVSKRRALAWDQEVGERAADMDTFVRFLVKQLVISLQGKAQNYRNDGPDGNAKGNLFMMNNTFYILELLGPTGDEKADEDNHRITLPWFKTKVSKIFENEKTRYLTHWEVLNTHLTAVDDNELNYQNNKDVLSLESGRLLKSRFSGFIEDL
jgi:exocyst complex protein 7